MFNSGRTCPLLLAAGLLLFSAMLRAGSSPLLPALPSIDGDVYATHVQDNILYIGGNFSTVAAGSINRNGLAAINMATGNVLPDWNPDLGVAEARVLLPASDGKTLFVGGTFVTVGGAGHKLVAEIDIDPASSSYGQVRDWDPLMSGNAVYALAWSADGLQLYVGGDFNQIGIASHQNLAAIDRVTAQAAPWYPEPDGTVHSLLGSVDGSRLYAGGEFGVIGSSADGREPRKALAAVNTSTAAVLGWNPALVGNAVYDMRFSVDGDGLYIGGLFSEAGSAARANLARLDTETAQAVPGWVADTDAAVHVLMVDASGALFVGGVYSVINGAGRSQLSMLDAADASLLPWLPLIGSGSVRALAVNNTSNALVVGGSYAEVGGDTSHQNIAVFLKAPPVTVSSSDKGIATNTPPMTVTLTCTDHGGASPCAATYVTMDGAEPTLSSPVYSAPIMISATTALKFFSVDGDGNREAVQNEIYTVDVDAPLTTVSPGLAVLNASSYKAVELVCDDGIDGSGCATTYYTLDGSTPTVASAIYTVPIELPDGATTVKYFSVDSAGNDESIQSAVRQTDYIVDLDLPTISVSHDSGNYTPPLTVTVICDDGAGLGCDEIYMTTDGTVPVETATPVGYAGPLEVTLENASILRVHVSDLAGNSGSNIIGIYTFTDPEPLMRSGSGALLWLPLLLLPLILRRRLWLSGGNAAYR